MNLPILRIIVLLEVLIVIAAVVYIFSESTPSWWMISLIGLLVVILLKDITRFHKRLAPHHDGEEAHEAYLSRTHNKDFDKTLKDAYRIFEAHRPQKGDTWKTVQLDYLWNKLGEELDEVSNCKKGEQYREALDVLNVVLMLATRLRTQSEDVAKV